MPVTLDMLPELMGFIATMNTTSAATFNNIEQCLRETIALAYQASWNLLTDLFLDDGSVHSIPMMSSGRRSSHPACMLVRLEPPAHCRKADLDVAPESLQWEGGARLYARGYPHGPAGDLTTRR
jgi:hypothetical protein